MNRKEALKILGFSPSDNPSEYEIRKAYRKLALEYHPDKHSSASEDVQKYNEEKFKELGAAYDLLTGKDTEEVTKLTDENLDKINSPEDLKFYLYEAISEGNTAFLKKLFSKFKSSKDGKFGDYINDNIYACPALMLSVLKGGNIKIIKLLLENGANCHVQDEYGDTALHQACSGCYDEVVELLLKHGVNPNIQRKNGDTALFAHIMFGLPRNADSKITELLLKHVADPNIKNNDKDTILSDACFYRNSKVVELLLKYGADPDTNSNSALGWAFYRGYNEIVELLLQYRADPNAILVWACQSGNVDVVELLLKYGADPKRKVDGKSPVESLGHRNRVEIIKLLAQYSGVEKHYLRNRAIEAVVFCCFAAGFTALGVMYSPWCFIPSSNLYNLYMSCCKRYCEGSISHRNKRTFS